MKQLLALGIIVVLLTSCGGGLGSHNTGLTISPNNITLRQGATLRFFATSDAVTWSVREGSAGGSITSSGLYTAPNAAGTFHVVATSQSDSTVSAATVVTVPKVGVTTQSPI